MTKEEKRKAIQDIVEELIGWDLCMLYLDDEDRTRRYSGIGPDWTDPTQKEAESAIDRLVELCN